MISGILQDLFQLKVADGQISRLQSVGRRALQAGYNDIVVDILDSAVLNIDEKGWRQNGNKAWLWTVVGSLGSWRHCLPCGLRVPVTKFIICWVMISTALWSATAVRPTNIWQMTAASTR